MAERNGISIGKSTTFEKRNQILRHANRLIGKKVFIETYLFNYRGRLLSVNEDCSLNLLILASDDLFREIRIDLALILEIGELMYEATFPIKVNDEFTCDNSMITKINSISVFETTSSKTQKRITQLASQFKGKIVIIKTFLYDFVACIIENNDSDPYITVRQVVDLQPHFVIEYRISKNIIFDIVDYPY